MELTEQLTAAEGKLESARQMYDGRAELFADAEADAWLQWAGYQVQQHVRANPDLILGKSDSERARMKFGLEGYISLQRPFVRSAVLAEIRAIPDDSSASISTEWVRKRADYQLGLQNEAFGAELIELGFPEARWSNSVAWYAPPGAPTPMGNPREEFTSSSGQEAPIAQYAKDVVEARRARDAIQQQIDSKSALDAWNSAG